MTSSLSSVSHFRRLHSKSMHIFTNVLLYAVVFICYAFLIILYISPQTYHIRGFVEPGGFPTPASTVTIICAAFIPASIAIATCSVEQALWQKLSPRREVKRKITVRESRRLAQWSVSPLGRLDYVLQGHSWALRAGAILVLSTALVNALLVSGISQKEDINLMEHTYDHSIPIFAGWLDVANENYNGENHRDTLGTVAALAYLSNLSAPASPVCSEPICSARATAASIKAECSGSRQDNLHNIGSVGTVSDEQHEFCSPRNPALCATIGSEGPYVYANFTGGFPPGCETNRIASECIGQFSRIFGVYVSEPQQSNSTHSLNLVDCTLTYGTVKIIQQGGTMPSIEPDSFELSNMDLITVGLNWLSLIYTNEHAYASPYNFTAASSTGDPGNSLYSSAIATLLLGPTASASADTVAQSISKSFELATLMAFARSPSASDITVTSSTAKLVFVYNPKVLAILISPLLTILLGVWGRWRIEGGDCVIGYDPIEIARLGPFESLDGNVSEVILEDQARLGEKVVAQARETVVDSDAGELQRDNIGIELRE